GRTECRPDPGDRTGDGRGTEPIDRGPAARRQANTLNGALSIGDDRGHIATGLGDLGGPDESWPPGLVRRLLDLEARYIRLRQCRLPERVLLELGQDRPVAITDTERSGARRPHLRIDVDPPELPLQPVQVPGEDLGGGHADTQLADRLIRDVGDEAHLSFA